MATAPNPASTFVSQISLVGRSRGLVKTLAGFKKQHHTVPDAVNAATTAFLGKLCAGELSEEAEQYFQRARTLFAYKRTDLSLEVASPTAVLTARDFILEISYALERGDPAGYESTRTLHSLGSSELAGRREFNELFAGRFSGIVFRLTQGARVEAVIDAVESQPPGSGLTVTFPSDCRDCVLAVEGVAAEVGCDGATLEMRFLRPGSPADLIAEFMRVRSAFALTGNRVLAGLL
jgi:hypothetical protein